MLKDLMEQMCLSVTQLNDDVEMCIRDRDGKIHGEGS